MLDRLTRAYRSIHHRLTADSESATDSNGYLSYRAEWHAAAWGLSAAFLAFALGRPELLAGALGWVLTAKNSRDAPAYIPYPKQFLKESAYLLGHALAGALLALLVNGTLL